MSDAVFRRLKAWSPFTPGIARLGKQAVAFSYVNGFLHSLQENFVDEVYRFDHSTDAPRIIDASAALG